MKVKMTSKDPDIVGSFAALKRASKAAFQLAKATGTSFHVMQDGRIVDLNPPAKRRRKT